MHNPAEQAVITGASLLAHSSQLQEGLLALAERLEAVAQTRFWKRGRDAGEQLAQNVRHVADCVAQLASDEVLTQANSRQPEDMLLLRLLREPPNAKAGLIDGYFDHLPLETLQAASQYLNLLSREKLAAGAKRALSGPSESEQAGISGLTDVNLTIIAVEVQGALKRKEAIADVRGRP
jgi:hypothetical protein